MRATHSKCPATERDPRVELSLTRLIEVMNERLLFLIEGGGGSKSFGPEHERARAKADFHARPNS